MERIKTSEISIETLPALRVACYRAVSASPEEDASGFMNDWIARNSPDTPSESYGFDTDVTQEQSKKGLRGYEIWRTVPPEVEASEGVAIQEFSGGLYAVMTLYYPFEDPFQRIPSGWHQLHEWVITSDSYHGGNHQWLEQLLHDEGGEHLKLYHPIKEAV